jgi:hypothetical protein
MCHTPHPTTPANPNTTPSMCAHSPGVVSDEGRDPGQVVGKGALAARAPKVPVGLLVSNQLQHSSSSGLHVGNTQPQQQWRLSRSIF